MSKSVFTDPLSIEGRLYDGNAYGLDYKDGRTIRVCDFAGPDGLWARIKEAKKANDVVIFTGARSAAGGKLDGYAVLEVADVVGLRCWGPSILGAGAFEAKVAKLEEEMGRMSDALAEHAQRINEIEADVDEEFGEVEPPEGQVGPDGTITPIPLGTDAEIPAEAREAMAGASDEE